MVSEHQVLYTGLPDSRLGVSLSYWCRPLSHGRARTECARFWAGDTADTKEKGALRNDFFWWERVQYLEASSVALQAGRTPSHHLQLHMRSTLDVYVFGCRQWHSLRGCRGFGWGTAINSPAELIIIDDPISVDIQQLHNDDACSGVGFECRAKDALHPRGCYCFFVKAPNSTVYTDKCKKLPNGPHNLRGYIIA